MAEQVRYKRSNMALRVPTVSFEGAKAQARGFQGIARSLDSMSNYFFQMAEQKAQIEGAEYGATNAPTQQQIEDAYQRGEEIELPGDQSSVYGRAVRKAALSVAADEISALANTRITEIAGIFDTVVTSPNMPEETKNAFLQQLGIQDFSPQSFGLVLDTVIAGYGKTLDKTSPALARSFRAEQAIVANTKWNSYLEAYVKQENEKLETSFRSNHNETYNVSSVAGIINGKGGADILEKKRKDETTKSISFLTGAELKTFQDNMDKVDKSAALQVLTDGTFGADDPIQVIKDVQAGKTSGLSDGMQLSVKILRKQGMSDTDIAQELRKRRTEQINFEESEEDNKNSAAETSEDQAIGAAMRAMLIGDTDAFETEVAIIDRTNPEKAAELTTKYTEAGERRTQSDPDSVAFLRDKGTNISFGDVADHFDKLSNKDRKFYSEQAQKYEDDEYAAAANWLKGAMNIPEDIQIISEDDVNYKRYQLFSRLKGELERRLTQARKEGRNFDSIAEAETLLRENDVFLADEVKRRTISSANDIIRSMNVTGAPFDGYSEIEENDFGRAIFFIDGLLSIKHKKRPYGFARDDLKNALIGYKEKLKLAQEASQ